MNALYSINLRIQNHVLRCDSQQKNDKWDETLHALKNKMIVGKLNQLRGNESNWQTNVSKSLHSIVLAQSLIGWLSFLDAAYQLSGKHMVQHFYQRIIVKCFGMHS